jgi:hypothetical protein
MTYGIAYNATYGIAYNTTYHIAYHIAYNTIYHIIYNMTYRIVYNLTYKITYNTKFNINNTKYNEYTIKTFRTIPQIEQLMVSQCGEIHISPSISKSLPLLVLELQSLKNRWWIRNSSHKMHLSHS